MSQINASDEELLVAFSVAFNTRFPNPNVKFNLSVTPQAAFCLLAQLQVSLRDPDNTGSTAASALGIAHELAKGLAGDSPAIQEIVRRGWERKGRPPLVDGVELTEPAFVNDAATAILNFLEKSGASLCVKVGYPMKGTDLPRAPEGAMVCVHGEKTPAFLDDLQQLILKHGLKS